MLKPGDTFERYTIDAEEAARRAHLAALDAEEQERRRKAAEKEAHRAAKAEEQARLAAEAEEAGYRRARDCR